LIGPYNSGCAKVALPITNESASGPLATIGPTDTYVGLTAAGPSTPPVEPQSFYPTGVRSFVRLDGSDQAQGVVDALLAVDLRLHRIYLLDDGTPTAVADSTYTARAAARLGLRAVGRASWSPSAAADRALAARVAAARPDGVYMAGCLCFNGLPLFRALRAVLPASVVFSRPTTSRRATSYSAGSRPPAST
jgi:branched-chain amino acid transport system substrate-binding protein